MKRSIVMSFTSLAIISFVNLVHADFVITLGSSNACSSISGQWVGAATLSNWLIDCSYHGSGSATPIDGSGNFAMDFSANKDAGSLLCPNQYMDHFSGHCSDGLVTIFTNYGNLVGNVLGNTGNVKGIVTILGVNAELTIKMNKIG
ncbi:MAG: hypothetical protein KIT56_10205 [Gammaproteobacteria bacterium]|nr:hypothetical protein [Gammaproteobacteria bacterium]MCW5584221.1 hypothetical protein [Gammaproteobacteria bacterium]